LPLPLELLLWIPYLSGQAAAAVVFTFCANVPRPIVSSRFVWVALWTPMTAAVLLPVRRMFHLMYATTPAGLGAWTDAPVTLLSVFYVAAGVVTLVWQYRGLDDVTDRRRVKVVLVGAVAGLVPGLLVLSAARGSSGPDVLAPIFASRLMAFGALTLLIFPGALAYAVLRHRLFDIGVLVRQGVRAIDCWLACKSQPINLISASFDPSVSSVDAAQSTRCGSTRSRRRYDINVYAGELEVRPPGAPTSWAAEEGARPFADSW
jgi:hypothetical protein